MSALLDELGSRLPSRVYAHLTDGLLDVLAPRLVPETPPVDHRKLGLVDATKLAGASKKSSDPAQGQQLLDAIDEIGKIFWENKS